MVGGLKWFSREDTLQLNFSKRKRGRKSEKFLGIPIRLTKRDCLSKVAEFFDPLGRITPTTSSMKLDIHELHLLNLDWDDVIPDSLREIWVSHLQMMKRIASGRFQKVVIPEDAVDTCETIDVGDASDSDSAGEEINGERAVQQTFVYPAVGKPSVTDSQLCQQSSD